MSFAVRLPIAAAGVAAFAALAAPAPAEAVPVGPYASICQAGKPAALVRVSGFKAARGNVEVKVYRSDKSFLEKGAFIRKVEVPVNRAGPIDICVPVPANGRYALSVRHEINGKKSRSDGGGFSGNPDVSTMDLVLKRKPSLAKVSFQVAGSTRVVPVVLSYLQGGSFRPIS